MYDKSIHRVLHLTIQGGPCTHDGLEHVPELHVNIDHLCQLFNVMAVAHRNLIQLTPIAIRSTIKVKPTATG
jgi:hypothetical protein